MYWLEILNNAFSSESESLERIYWSLNPNVHILYFTDF